MPSPVKTLCDPDALFFKRLLNLGNIDLPARHSVLKRDSGSYPCALARDRTTHHLAGGRVGYLVSGNTATGNQQIFHLLGKYDAIGNLKVPARGRYDHHGRGV